MSWNQMKLGELYDVHNGLSKGSNFFGSGYPFLSFSVVFNNFFIPDDLNDLVQSTEKEQESFSIKSGDVFITRTSETMDELGMSCVALKDYEKATYNGFTKRLRPKTEELVLPKYIGYYLRTPMFRGKFKAFSSMTTRASLKNEDLLNMEIPVPPLEIQQRIASILSAYDDLIENNQKQIKLLEEAAQRLYKEWFVDLRFPGHEQVKIVDGVPEGWEKVRIGSKVKLLSGYAFKSKTFEKNGKYKLVTIKNVLDGRFNGKDTDRISDLPNNLPDYCLLSDGDILLSLTGNVGRVCFVYGCNYVLNQRVAKLSGGHKGFIYCLFRNRVMFQMMNNLANGTAQKNLSPIKVEGETILYPSTSISEEFESVIKPILCKILLLNKEIENLQEARDRLLPKLMSGEIEV